MRTKRRKPKSNRIAVRVAIVGVVLAAGLTAWKRGCLSCLPPISPGKDISRTAAVFSASTPTQARPRHEATQVYMPVVLVLLALIVLSALVIHAVLWNWLKHIPGAAPYEAAVISNPKPLHQLKPGIPLLQINPENDWRYYQRQEQSNLHTLGALNTRGATARVPVETAMDQIVERGLPRWDPNRSTSPLELQRQRATNGGNRP